MSNAKPLNIILLGAPGSGKGTQAKRLEQKFNIPQIATGDLFRYNLKNNTALGQLAKSYMDQGVLVPDDVTAKMVADRFLQPDVANGFILDGFPRNIPQAKALANILSEMGRDVSGVLYIKVSDDEIVSRLSGRIICKKCQTPFHKSYNPFKTCPTNECEGEHLYQRDDDKPETVKTRLETYHDQTAPLIDFYAAKLIEITGEGDLDDITTAVTTALENL